LISVRTRRLNRRRVIANDFRHRLAIPGKDHFLAPLDRRQKGVPVLPGIANIELHD
jgi:hypothetical protein